MDTSRLINGSCGDSGVDLQGESQSDNPPANNLYRPKVHVDVLGREFSSCDNAYKFYVDYGRKSGFNVRKHHQTKNKMNLVSRVSYCCSKEGYRQKDKRREVVTYSQPISRVGCRAHMTCLLQKNGKFRVVSFEEGHNHDLIATPMKHMLKINRSMSEAQKAHANDAENVGLPIKATVDLMSIEVGGRDNLGFLDKDYRNYIHSKRKTKMKKGDVGVILQYFQKMHSENSSYFYAMQVDDDDMITNIFWADARSVSDYNLFGDVVCFDTTYLTNEYGRPFAPFVGVNHHKQTVVFGAALLYDETTTSFR
ncbi:hypothetical protein ACFX14_001621 [Malus domestica]